MDKTSNSIYKQKAVEVIEAKHQVVAGSLYHLKLRVAETNCKKNDQATTTCEQQPNVVSNSVCSFDSLCMSLETEWTEKKPI